MPIPFGHFRPAESELGDGAIPAAAPPQSNFGRISLPVQYYVLPQGSFTVDVLYDIEHVDHFGLAIYYLVGPAHNTFAINGTTEIPAPETMRYIPPGQLGLDLSLGVVIQGYAAVSWSWASLSYSEAETLLSFYNPQAPQVTVTYPNEQGFWVTRNAMMQPPQIGQRAGGESYQGLTLLFTHIIPD